MAEIIPSPADLKLIEKMDATLQRAEARFESRKTEQAKRAREALDAKLANFDLYVESVLDSKAIKILTCKTERKKKRIQDEMEYTRRHYRDVRANMIKAAEGALTAYKEPLYLREARAQAAAARAKVYGTPTA